jgi:hypothetical protein
MHNRRLTPRIRIPSHRHPIKRPSTAHSYYLTLLLDVTSLITLVQQLQKRNGSIENGCGVDGEGLGEVFDIPVVEVVPEVGE